MHPGDRVLEIGPGQGDLTASLIGAGCDVLAVEIDRKLIPGLRERFGSSPHFELLEADALDGKHALNPALALKLGGWGSYHLVSNLPYAAGTPLLVNLLTGPCAPVRSVVMLQYEVAARLTASPGSKAYGALTIQMANVAQSRLLQKVPPGCFTPPPKVDSALVELVGCPPQVDPGALRRLVAHLFGQRRKSIGKRLMVLGMDPSALGIDPKARAEDLEPEAFFNLVRQCQPLLTPPKNPPNAVK